MDDTNSFSAINGSLEINSESYSARDIIETLISQGIPIKQVGSNLRLGTRIIPPVVNDAATFASIDKKVTNGLETQISRIFSEISKLKQHLGLLEHSPSKFLKTSNPFTSENESSSTDKFSFETGNRTSNSHNYSKWGRNKKPNQTQNPDRVNRIKQEDVPIYTFGKKKKSDSLVSKFQELTRDGVSELKALDKLSSNFLDSSTDTEIPKNIKKSIIADLNSKNLEQQDKTKPTFRRDEVNGSSEQTTLISNHGKCNCGMTIPTGAKYCARCGKKIIFSD